MEFARFEVRTVFLIGLLLIGFGLSPAVAQAVADGGTLTVSGEAELRLVPDTAYVVVGVNSQADTAAVAAGTNSEAVKKLVEVLKSEGIAAGDLQTSGFSLAPRYSTVRPGTGEPPRVVAFAANTQLNVKVRELAKLGALLDKLLAAGATNVRIVTLDVADRERFVDDLRHRAVDNARHRASVYAAAAGVTLGPLLSFSEDSAPLIGASGAHGTNESLGSASTAIEPGEITSRLRVQITWRILTN